MTDDNEHTPLLVNRDPGHTCLTTTVNLIALVSTILTAFLLACFPLALSTGLQPPDSKLNKTQNCILTINSSDSKQFQDYVKSDKSQLIFVHLDFEPPNSNTSDICGKCDAILPFHWVWASASTGRVFKYWQQDYSVWSFGILDVYTKRNVSLKLQVPKSCELVPGTPSTMNIIAQSLNRMTRKMLGRHYKNSMWCYKTKFSRKSSFLYLLERNFRHFILDVKNQCCQFKPDRSSCDNERVFPGTFWTVIPFAISYLVLLYSPVIFVYFANWFFTTPPVHWLSWGMAVSHDYSHHVSDYIHLEFDSPVSFTSMLVDVVSWFINKLPKSIGKNWVNYVLLVLLSPVVIYTKVWIYHSNKDLNELMKTLVENDVPVGFSSVTSPFEKKSTNFLTIFYGPCIFFLVFYMLGIAFVFLNEIMKNTINVTVDRGQRYVPLSSLNLHLFESVRNVSLTNKTLNIIAENSIVRSLSLSFWKDVWIEYRRDSTLSVSLVKVCLSFLVHQVPFLFTSHLLLRSYMYGVLDSMALTVRRKHPKTGFCLTVCTCMGLATCHFVLIFAVATILFASLEFISLVGTFSFVTLVIYPAASEGFFLFGASALIFLCRCFRGIACTYQHLLFLSVEVSKKIKKHRLRQNPNDNHEYLRHINGCYGIPRELFEKIIDVYEPRKNIFLKAVFKMVVVGSILAWVLYLIINLHEGHEAIDQLVKAFTAFVIVSIPELLSLLTKDTRQQTEDVICKNNLRYTIEKYWEDREKRATLDRVPRTYSCP